jgi:hypothetical protein
MPRGRAITADPRRPRPTRTGTIKRMVSNMIEARAELKRTVATTSTTASATGATIYKSSIAQGDTYDTRTGDKIRLHSIEWTAAFTDTANNLCRFVVVADTSNTGAAPAVSDILSGTNVFAHMNAIYEIQHRFRVLLDVVVSTSAAGQQYTIRRGTIKAKFPIYFNGTDATTTSGGKSALYAVVISAASTGTYTLTTNIRFTDI